MTIRICPERDAACPHGMACPHTLDRYQCAPGWNTPAPTPSVPLSTSGLSEGEGAIKDTNDDGPPAIWLQPLCQDTGGEGRCWMPDMGEECDCTPPCWPTKYIRADLSPAPVLQGDVAGAFERARGVAKMLHTNARVRRGEKGVKAWDGSFVEREYQALMALPEQPATLADMAAFGASEAACVYYPGENEQPERAAFCAGAALSSLASSPIQAKPDVTALVEAARKVRAAYDQFLTCNDGFMGNQGDAYQHLFKAAAQDWNDLKDALSAFQDHQGGA